MTLEGVGKLYEHSKGRVFLYIPADLHKDSQFPLKIGEKVTVRIEGKKLVVEIIK